MANSNPRVLLVDDNRDAVDMLSLLLSYSNVETRVAYDGQSAVVLLQEWPAQLVFLDIQMPRMNGYQTAVAMHALPGCAAVPIVAMTAWDGIGDVRLIEAARFEGRIAKPTLLQDILEVINRLVVPG